MNILGKPSSPITMIGVLGELGVCGLNGGERGLPSRDCLSSVSEYKSSVQEIRGSDISLIGEMSR